MGDRVTFVVATLGLKEFLLVREFYICDLDVISLGIMHVSGSRDCMYF